MNIITTRTPVCVPTSAAQPSAPAPAPTPAPAPPADEFLHQLVTKKDAAELEKFRQALNGEIFKTVGSMVTGWSTPHVEKPAFPYQVQKQARIYAPQAHAQVAQNQAAVLGLLANPSVDNALLMGVETQLNPSATPINHDLADPDFRLFYNSLRDGANNRGQFEFSGTLVNVGWGAGDHVNVSSSHLPSGPKTVSQHLAQSTTSSLAK